MTTGLRARDCSVRFGGVKALDHLSVDIPEGLVTAIIGPNGAGKTSFFNVVSGFVRPDAGDVTFNGRSVIGMSPHAVARCGVVRTFQELRLFENMSAADNLDLVHGARDSSDVLAQLGIERYKNVQASSLPYAVQKLVAIGRGLMMRPSLLLLDEPTSGLDPDSRAVVLDRISALTADGVGVCLVEHNLDVVRKIDPRIVCFHQGRLFREGTYRELEASAEVREIFFGDSADL